MGGSQSKSRLSHALDKRISQQGERVMGVQRTEMLKFRERGDINGLAEVERCLPTSSEES